MRHRVRLDPEPTDLDSYAVLYPDPGDAEGIKITSGGGAGGAVHRNAMLQRQPPDPGGMIRMLVSDEHGIECSDVEADALEASRQLPQVETVVDEHAVRCEPVARLDNKTVATTARAETAEPQHRGLVNATGL